MNGFETSFVLTLNSFQSPKMLRKIKSWETRCSSCVDEKNMNQALFTRRFKILANNPPPLQGI